MASITLTDNELTSANVADVYTPIGTIEDSNLVCLINPYETGDTTVTATMEQFSAYVASSYYKLLSTLQESIDTANTAASGANTAASEVTAVTEACETATTNCETATANCEAATATCEDLNEHQPYVGSDGYWYKWDTSTDAYVKTDTLSYAIAVYPTFEVDTDTMQLTMTVDYEEQENRYAVSDDGYLTITY